MNYRAFHQVYGGGYYCPQCEEVQEALAAERVKEAREHLKLDMNDRERLNELIRYVADHPTSIFSEILGGEQIQTFVANYLGFHLELNVPLETAKSA